MARKPISNDMIFTTTVTIPLEPNMGLAPLAALSPQMAGLLVASGLLQGPVERERLVKVFT